MGVRGGIDEVQRRAARGARDGAKRSPAWLSRHAIRLARDMNDELGQPAEVTDLALVHEVMAVLAARLDHPSSFRSRDARGGRAPGGSTTDR